MLVELEPRLLVLDAVEAAEQIGLRRRCRPPRRVAGRGSAPRDTASPGCRSAPFDTASGAASCSSFPRQTSCGSRSGLRGYSRGFAASSSAIRPRSPRSGCSSAPCRRGGERLDRGLGPGPACQGLPPPLAPAHKGTHRGRGNRRLAVGRLGCNLTNSRAGSPPALRQFPCLAKSATTRAYCQSRAQAACNSPSTVSTTSC